MSASAEQYFKIFIRGGIHYLPSDNSLNHEPRSLKHNGWQ